jgi:hypothetical protein
MTGRAKIVLREEDIRHALRIPEDVAVKTIYMTQDPVIINVVLLGDDLPEDTRGTESPILPMTRDFIELASPAAGEPSTIPVLVVEKFQPES